VIFLSSNTTTAARDVSGSIGNYNNMENTFTLAVNLFCSDITNQSSVQKYTVVCSNEVEFTRHLTKCSEPLSKILSCERHRELLQRLPFHAMRCTARNQKLTGVRILSSSPTKLKAKVSIAEQTLGRCSYWARFSTSLLI